MLAYGESDESMVSAMVSAKNGEKSFGSGTHHLVVLVGVRPNIVHLPKKKRFKSKKAFAWVGSTC